MVIAQPRLDVLEVAALGRFRSGRYTANGKFQDADSASGEGLPHASTPDLAVDGGLDLTNGLPPRHQKLRGVLQRRLAVSQVSTHSLQLVAGVTPCSAASGGAIRVLVGTAFGWVPEPEMTDSVFRNQRS